MTNHPNRNSNWQYKVVKSQRGAQGKWFSYSAAATFADKDKAIRYAEGFADEQRKAGVVGTRINVLSRRQFKGEFGLTNNVAEFRV